jgi:trigger factor
VSTDVTGNATELGPFERQITVAIDGEKLEAAKTRAARRWSKDMKIKGFRPGKAPRQIVENAVGSDRLKEEAIEEVLPELVSSALDAAELSPAITPTVEEIRDLDDGVELDVRVTLWPTPDTVPDFDGRRVEIEAPPLDDDAIDGQVDRLRDQFAELQTVERPSIHGDYVAINLAASQGGEPVEAASASDLLYEVGSDGLLTGLDDAVVGRSVGDIENFTTTLPEGFGGEMAGTEVDIQVLVKEVKEKLLPTLDDEWVSDNTEFETVGELRGELEARLDDMRLSHFQDDFHSKLMSEMLEELEVEVPAGIIDGEMDTIFHRFVYQLGDNEIEFADYLELSGQSEESFLADLRDQATRRVRTDVLLDAIASQAEIEVAADELAGAYEALSSQVDETSEELAGRMAGSVQELRIAGDILRRKALDTLVRSAVAVDQDGNMVDLRFDLPESDQTEADEPESDRPQSDDSDPPAVDTEEDPDVNTEEEEDETASEMTSDTPMPNDPDEVDPDEEANTENEKSE